MNRSVNIKNMDKRLWLSLAVASWTGLESVQAAQPEQRPNIILFLVDDMGLQDTSVQFWKQRTSSN